MNDEALTDAELHDLSERLDDVDTALVDAADRLARMRATQDVINEQLAELSTLLRRLLDVA